MKEGLRCSGAIPYGYKRINGDKQTLVVDEPAAEIVRKVFRLACHGMGVTAIAEQLTEEKVLIPSAYTAKYFPENCRNRSFSDPYRWNANTIGHILDRQEYLGHTVLGKSICENFKTKQRRAATPEELMIFPDTHEAIIDQDTWDIAQKLRVRAKPRAANGTYSHRLSGMIYCADCGSRMGFISPEARQSGKHYDSDSAFQCGNYRNQNNECVSHFIKTSALEAAILQAIKAVSQYVIENEAEFISQLKTVWNESKSKSANNGQQEIDEAKKRMAELDAKIQKLYDSAISGLLPERQAQRMIQQYDEEQLMTLTKTASVSSSHPADGKAIRKIPLTGTNSTMPRNGGMVGKLFRTNIWNLPEVQNGLICVPMKDRDLTLSRQSTWERLSLRWSEKALPPTSAISTETLKPPTA